MTYSYIFFSQNFYKILVLNIFFITTRLDSLSTTLVFSFIDQILKYKIFMYFHIKEHK